ncbi:MAG: MBL fold metallo-hydrolase [Alphaproteobacteria bacterium]|jgi:glyoxylase-like metal-dependent hydrolase (beta-lactamase superfamily II)|nr:MBL fold metallo-hydrolase [Alphaproteobacteria bacterium]MBU2042730.1 MBL fold metallo-hydrolase [Alphaproteobacteria bacterium]MBU2126742.1 MBL fold metallo-hydrolase [Alphaproteobacteria bacterium]MBU2208066.1 MBL fold metallo-hydrolase [Alphaproteobacteria bacterium]MBU2289707.1 MBL fold metallo-hydrolase [Alphaproteobacteria bacterium]
MNAHARLAVAAMILASLAACSPGADKAGAPASAAAQSPDIHAFRIGALEATSLKDGDIVLQNVGDQSPWSDTAGVRAALVAAGLSGESIVLSVQPLLVRDGERVVLIDTGAGGRMGTRNKLVSSLRSAGVDPTQVTDVLISHAHGDHIGGLVGSDGSLTFPRAVVHISAPEWESLKAGAAQAGEVALLTAVSPRVRPFAPGAQVTPSIKAVALDGHTPGHTGYEIASGTDRLLYIGDAMHSAVISVQRPEWVNVWDTDSAAGVATRQELLERGASQPLKIYSPHFPFPGLGRFQRRDDGFVWVPETAAQP